LVWRRSGVPHHHLDPVEGDVELFGRQLRKRGPGACTEIHLPTEDRDAVFGTDGDPGINRFLDHGFRRAQRRGTGRAGHTRHGETDGENAARFQEIAAVE
jgi:hypothetical protein